MYASNVALRCRRHEARFCGAYTDSKKTIRSFEQQSWTSAAVYFVRHAKAIAKNADKVLLYNLQQRPPTFAELHLRRQISLVIPNASNLARVVIVSSTTPKSNDEANDELERPINACWTSIVTTFLEGWRLSSGIISFSDATWESTIVAPGFIASVVLQNPQSKLLLSNLNRSLVLNSSTC